MERGNVLVIGNSGVGKSTLINAVLGEERAKTSWGGSTGTTSRLEIYESDEIPFRVIDSIGFEPSFIKRIQAVNAVKKWSRDSSKEGKEDTQINVIWFCVDGTAGKLFQQTIRDLSDAVKMWKNVPVITVITKSYSAPDRVKNIDMVNNAFAKLKSSKNLVKVVPVVAYPYVIEDDVVREPYGISELIEATNDAMPEGKKAAEKDVHAFILGRKRGLAQSAVGVTTTGAVVIGAVPIPFADAAILTPLEIGEINAIAAVYGVGKDEKSKQFVNSIVEVGTVSAVAKAAISGIKAIPGLNVGASVLNAIVAGAFAAAIGEVSIYAFEQIYLGNKSLDDVDWVKKIVENKLSQGLLGHIEKIAKRLSENKDTKKIAGIIFEELFSK